jgi:hypothetical protein
VVGLFPLVLVGVTAPFYVVPGGGWNSDGHGLNYPVGLWGKRGEGECWVRLGLVLGCMSHVGHGMYIVAVHGPCFG